MVIQLNGEPYTVSEGTSIADLLIALELTERRVAVEVNLEIVPRSQHATTVLQANDQVEVVQAIGGG
ncbi:thiamine biosynthesis protein ThiS [Thiopseudomonas alkaliphila]|uniref:Sulfur carrier protein ThiS n=1 Tax=Thiopseudomonas alkaliphila TaxID=1697053 RepID=A0A0K1XE30_9GAMM|nr:sulfur carrier protein ThiS [Thiopseudomonas alkaliphila]AKX45198.1 thiamine biosynthesis protein ThiS [Thiopseudomonas alkaliphila]AKX47259.1 thiamine biosynthesis protein ThiS [Thiopseudomonas alkaliphila]AKX48517.1 thiamine biosynthesis protein ThiS [Thiopseudomonas alkaliphila]AKX51091.1 thiamine biosynthesis protein ThiS [Thiopseudomonas alkaliphila]AKX53639.1 thiamine biosynthesis protein ThiS [Thiopseudomonas alkaliphila]